ncbi:hypothetical protein JYU34_007197 [Plutella xylostella]|uniref:Uncharacterized protein n=1 Tax=Plutella xylostella TaxID=51655 RepID=A0ABQ7QPV6_PLUXY|nr:hypothetical protein JYU34_007197 [Plutella xylostella]
MWPALAVAVTRFPPPPAAPAPPAPAPAPPAPAPALIPTLLFSLRVSRVECTDSDSQNNEAHKLFALANL